MLTATSVGLGAIGYTCSATVCDGSTADMKAKFKLLQERLNAVNALIAVPPKALTVDGRLGRNTKDALIIAAATAAGYPDYAATLGKLLSYGAKPPTLAAIAASASALATELLVLRKAREKDGATSAPAADTLAPAAAAAQTAAEAATLRADALALVKGEAAPETVAARAAEETAKTAASAVASALNRLKPPPFGLPRITGTAQTDKLIYASAAIGALALVWYGYRKRQPATRAPAPAPAPAASAPVAGLRRRRRS